MAFDHLNFQDIQSRAPAQTSGRPRRRNNQTNRVGAAGAPSWGYNGPPIPTTGAVAGETSHQREVRIQNNISARRRRGGFSQSAPAQGGMADSLGASTLSSGYHPPMGRVHAGGMMVDGRPAVSPGNGSVYYYDNEYNPSEELDDDVDAYTQHYRQFNNSAGSGPYDSMSALRRFRSLRGSGPSRPLMQPPVGQRYGGGTEMIQMPDGRMVGVSQEFADSAMYGLEGASAAQRNAAIRGHYGDSRPGSLAWEANRIGAMNARGGHQVMVRTGPPKGGLSEEMEARRQEVIADQRSDRQSLRQGRRDRAIRRHGLTHLTPSYAEAPLDSMRYGRSAKPRQPTPQEQRDVTVSAYVARHTTTDGDTPVTDWRGAARDMFSTREFRENPRSAWPGLKRSGMTVADIDEAIKEEEGWTGIGSDQVLLQQLRELRAEATDGSGDGPGVSAPRPNRSRQQRPQQGPPTAPMYTGPFAGW